MLAGIDLSLTSTGLSVGGSTSIVTTPKRGAERLSIISSKIIDFCIENKIAVVMIEGYSFASRNSQAHSIGELGGCVRMRLWENQIRHIDVPPTSRAKFATGKGNASKMEVVSAISSKTGRMFVGAGADDECDAWILEEMGLCYMGLSKYDWPSTNRSALEKIDWSQLEEIK